MDSGLPRVPPGTVSRWHRAVIALECLVILLPVSLLALVGGYLAFTILIDHSATKEIAAAVFLPAMLLCLASLTALWLVSIPALFNWGLFQPSTVRGLYLLMHAGALMAGAAVLSFGVIVIFPSLEEWPIAALAMLYLGAPALVPYAHLVWLARRRLSA